MTGDERAPSDPELYLSPPDEAWRLRAALERVQRDVDATAARAHVFHFVTIEDISDAENDRLIYVALEDGGYWGGGPSCWANDEARATASVAAGVQDCLAEMDRQVWPVCRDHDRGGHVRRRDGTEFYREEDGAWGNDPTWWCNGGTGHALGAVGDLRG